MKKRLLSLSLLLLCIAPLRAQLGVSIYPMGKMIGLRTSGLSVVDARQPGFSGIYVDTYFELRTGFASTLRPNTRAYTTMTPDLTAFLRIGGRYPVSLLTGIGVAYGFSSTGTDNIGGLVPLALEYVPKGERFPQFSIKAETDVLWRHYSNGDQIELRPLIGVSCMLMRRAKTDVIVPATSTP